jgi:hypothetical protein
VRDMISWFGGLARTVAAIMACVAFPCGVFASIWLIVGTAWVYVPLLSIFLPSFLLSIMLCCVVLCLVSMQLIVSYPFLCTAASVLILPLLSVPLRCTTTLMATSSFSGTQRSALLHCDSHRTAHFQIKPNLPHAIVCYALRFLQVVVWIGSARCVLFNPRQHRKSRRNCGHCTSLARFHWCVNGLLDRYTNSNTPSIRRTLLVLSLTLYPASLLSCAVGALQ